MCTHKTIPAATAATATSQPTDKRKRALMLVCAHRVPNVNKRTATWNENEFYSAFCVWRFFFFCFGGTKDSNSDDDVYQKGEEEKNNLAFRRRCHKKRENESSEHQETKLQHTNFMADLSIFTTTFT